ncbi:hypothetical protein O6H91_03G029100 [Diphasiastrum complanatum]|uniref:Uncharacterized protein n=1 Tax=Diphasiastrum complanatum TaxID=34168 RepID=A0ACC2E4J1_DIPCM|nr:hypothetical protein O6H91_03G029100 [Diphasiastrum complanatum]
MNVLLWMWRVATGISLCLIMVSAVTFASVDPPATIASSPEPSGTAVSFCNTSVSFQSNSMFEQNLNILLKALLNDTPSSSDLLKEHVQGTDPDRVYGYSQCFFTSVSQANCSLCIERAVNQTSVLCPYAINATVYYDECVVRYGTRGTSPDNFEFFNPGKINDPLRQNLNKVWSLIRQEAPRTKSPVAFAYGSTPDIAFGFAQCHNLSEPDCMARFDGVIQLSPYMGGRIIAPDSFFRYENYSFFTGSGVTFQLLASSQSPLGLPIAPTSGNRKSAKKKSLGHVSIVIILTIVIGGAILLAVCVFLVICRKKMAPRSLEFSVEHPSASTKRFKQCPMFTYENLKDATRNFHEDNKLGKGGFGIVYKGILFDGSEVAIKHLSLGSTQGNEEFVNEVAIITTIKHKNLVKLRGCCIEGNERLLVYEYLEHKSLDLFLFGKHLLNWKARYNIAVGIARGLNYLHEESEPRILHRDIKATNVLLDMKFQPKISDFGLSRFFFDDESFVATMRLAGTRGYIAPEAATGYLTLKSDIFSFGVLLLEIVSGRKNHEISLQTNAQSTVDLASQLCKEGRPLELIDPRLDGDYHKNQAMNLIDIAMSCTQVDASIRPKMSNVVAMLLDYAKVSL